MVSVKSAHESAIRTDTNAKVRSLIQLTERFSSTQLRDYTLQTVPSSGNTIFSFFVGTRAYKEDLNDEDNWVMLQIKDIESLSTFLSFDSKHPINPEKGYFSYFANIYTEEAIKKARTLWYDSERKIAMDVYDYSDEGDGMISIGFADGHVSPESTDLKGIDDDIGTLITTVVHSRPGHVK